MKNPSRRNIRLGLLGLMVMGMLAAPGARAQVYKCVGADGKTVYLQSPCPAGAKTSVIKSDPGPAPSPAAADAKGKKPAASAADQDMEFRKRQLEREAAAKKSDAQTEEDKRNQDACKRARETIANYDIGGRISRVDDKGERYIMGDNEIAQERAKAQEAVNRTCK